MTKRGLLLLLGERGALETTAGFLALTAAALLPAAANFERCRTFWHTPRMVEA